MPRDYKKSTGYKEVTGAPDPTVPIEIVDIKQAIQDDLDVTADSCGVFSMFTTDEMKKFIIDFNPKYAYLPAEDGDVTEDMIPNQKVFKVFEVDGLRKNSKSKFTIRKAKVGNQEVLIFTPDQFFGGGDVVLTQKESPELVELARDHMSKYGKRAKHFSFFSNIKEQLTDAPTEVKRAFNEVVNYFSNHFGEYNDLDSFLSYFEDLIKDARRDATDQKVYDILKEAVYKLDKLVYLPPKRGVSRGGKYGKGDNYGK